MNPEIPNCFYRVSVKALILDETRTKFLIVQENNGKWELPGGGLDWGESPDTGLKREIREEMGLEALSIKSNPSYFTSGYKRDNTTYGASVLYEVTLNSLDFVPSEECVAIRFVTGDEAKSLETFPSLDAFANLFDPKNHIA